MPFVSGLSPPPWPIYCRLLPPCFLPHLLPSASSPLPDLLLLALFLTHCLLSPLSPAATCSYRSSHLLPPRCRLLPHGLIYIAACSLPHPLTSVPSLTCCRLLPFSSTAICLLLPPPFIAVCCPSHLLLPYVSFLTCCFLICCLTQKHNCNNKRVILLPGRNQSISQETIPQDNLGLINLN